MRTVRLVAVLLAAGAFVAVAAGPAVAAPGDPLAASGPADGARLTAGAPPGLRARSVAGDSGLELRVSRSAAAIDACGRINAEVAQAQGTPVAGDPALYDFATGPWYDTAGTYSWQVIRTGADGSCKATAARRLVLSGALPARPELAGLSQERVPRSIGSSNGASFRIRAGGIPAGVSRARFLALVRNSGRRWRLHSIGTLSGRPRFGNGISEVGFSTSQVSRQALAVTIIGRKRGGGLERDLILRGDIPWDEGPAHPSRAQIDLETVLLHEFGHVAGNRFHVPRGCHDTPMVVGLATGEWWRSTTDFSYRACNTGG
ncbi:MAG: hypothetical protein QOH72_410 [Solirubrobacteraceae bacterium]|jgi:hypothetical protein|nr:hypothetical protein [Solirubrobacteraceae bacterium]